MTPEYRQKCLDAFVNYFVLSVELFRDNYCGYWLRREAKLEIDGALAVLAAEVEDDSREGIKALDALSEKVTALALAKEPLPAGWFLIDRALGERAYAIGERRWGEDWFDDRGDADTYDVVIQVALLGKVTYG